MYNRIGEVYYNFSKATLLVDRRDGRPRLQHNRDLCQACLTGECWNGPGDIINAEVSTLRPLISFDTPDKNIKSEEEKNYDLFCENWHCQPFSRISQKNKQHQYPKGVLISEFTNESICSKCLDLFLSHLKIKSFKSQLIKD